MSLETMWCRITGHDWERPVWEGGKRVEHCLRCTAVRDHDYVKPVQPPRWSQADLDGGTTVTVVVTPRVVVVEPEPVEAVDEVAARRAEIAATVRAKYGKVGAESKGVS